MLSVSGPSKADILSPLDGTMDMILDRVSKVGIFNAEDNTYPAGFHFVMVECSIFRVPLLPVEQFG